MAQTQTREELELRIKELEQKVREQEKQHLSFGCYSEVVFPYSQILDCAPSVIYAKDLQGKYTKINRQFELLSGLNSHQILGKTDFELFPEPVALNSSRNDKTVFVTGKPLEIEEFGPVNGQTHYFHSIKYPLFTEDGYVNGICGISTDITRQKLAERKRDESQTLFSSIFFNSPLAMVITRLEDGKIIEINENFIHISGYDRQQVLGQTSEQLGFWLDQKDREQVIQQLKKVKSIRGLTIKFVTKKGQERLGNVNLELAEIGVEMCIITTLEDVTEPKTLEYQLKESEARYRSLFDTNQTIMLLINPANAQIVDANPAAVSFYGWSYEDITQKKITDINQLPQNKVYQKMKDVQRKVPRSFSFRHRLANGEVRDVEVHSSPVTISDKKLLYSIIYDISERKKQEEELKNYEKIISQVHDLIYVVNAQGEIVFVNPVFEIVTSHKPSDFLGKPFTTLFDEQNLSLALEAFNRTLKGENVGKEIMFKDTSIVCEFNSMPLRDQNQKIIGIMGVARDITSRKKIEDERKSLNRILTNKVKERTSELESLNIALQVLLEKRNRDKIETEEKIINNYETLIIPLLDKLKNDPAQKRYRDLMTLLELNLKEIVSPFTKALSDPVRKLTPTEIRIASMIKHGLSNKEIANTLNKSISTITTHRAHIRRKLNLTNQKINLQSFLSDI